MWIFNINKVKKIGITELIQIKKSLIKNAGKGVFAKDTIPALFGDYYYGKFSKEIPKNDLYTWEIRTVKENEVRYKLGKTVGYVNGYNSGHWTSFVNCSLTENYANIGVFHTMDNRIFYYTKREIQRDEELLVWYGKEYYDTYFKEKDNKEWLT